MFSAKMGLFVCEEEDQHLCYCVLRLHIHLALYLQPAVNQWYPIKEPHENVIAVGVGVSKKSKQLICNM
jgi:hypothetical protein